uniref:Uncharacterized protein n=1 Tax=Arundo donax TaxID=35708 RepID=A0A0A9F762_ARUDO
MDSEISLTTTAEFLLMVTNTLTSLVCP